MVITIKGSLEDHRQSAQPTFYGPSSNPENGGLADIGGKVGPPIIIPPINTEISFDLPMYNPSEHRGLSDISEIPEEFDWRNAYSTDTDEITRKKALIAKPGNQALCGSCWAISGAGIISDNFVVSGLVTWLPNLSTTWTLACNPQAQCGGGNPQTLFNDVAKNGITSNHCVDYSWCMKDEMCSGSALHHFDTSKPSPKMPTTAELNALIPTCGCYYGEDEHYVYQIDSNVSQVSVTPTGSGDCGSPSAKEDISKFVEQANSNAVSVRNHIYSKGPVLGAFIVLNNFMKGEFTKINGGVYFEEGVYDGSGDIKFSPDQVSGETFKGGHAVAVIGWGIARNIVVDNNGKREDVPYWYVRNSWTETWGADGGYFKMAMYPWNKTSCFDALTRIKQNDGGSDACKLGGGFVMISVSKPPTKQKLDSIATHGQFLQDDKYYQDDSQDMPVGGSSGFGFSFLSLKLNSDMLYIVVPIVIVVLIVWYVRKNQWQNLAAN